MAIFGHLGLRNQSSWNLAQLITLGTRPHKQKVVYAGLRVYGGGRGHLACFFLFFSSFFTSTEWPFYCVQQVCQVPSNWIIFSRHVPQEFCNETFTLLSPPNLALCVATVLCKASNNLRACITRGLNNVIKQYNQSKREFFRSDRMSVWFSFWFIF